jgi:translocation and assembly module TamB
LRRLLKWIGGILLVLLAIPLLAAVVVAIVANMDAGRRLIERQTAELTGGMVHIEGLSGRFPDALRAARIQVSDAKGPYVTISGLLLDWSPLQLVHRTAQIDLLQADQLDFSRLPEPETKPRSSTSGSVNLPVRVDLHRLFIARATIGAPVAGAAATLALDGSADLTTLSEGSVRLDANRLDSPGHYAVGFHITPEQTVASIEADEPAKGLISSIAHLPDLGAITVQASANGPRNAMGTRAAINAGQLTASASGTVDLDRQAADLAVKAQAPAMSPAEGISWQSVLADATIHGPFAKPDAKGTVRIQTLNAGGVRIGALNADLAGNAGQAELHARAEDLHVPGPKPDIFAGGPVTLDASERLDDPSKPVTFALHHRLLALDGTARIEDNPRLQAHLVLPDLAPLAAAGGSDIAGHADLNLTAEMKDGTTSGTATGKVAITGGMAPIPALIGEDGRVDIAGSTHGEDYTLSHLTVNGKALTVTAQGGLVQKNLDLDWTVGLADLSAVRPGLSGTFDAKGHAGGALDALAVQADLGADVAAKGYSSGHITATVDATGLPNAPHATVNANGTLLEAPLTLALTADKTGDAIKVDIAKAAWKSLEAGGTASLTPPAVIPSGHLHIGLGRLADIEPLLGRPITGQANATLDSDDRTAKLALTLKDVALPGTAAVANAALNATVTDPAGHPVIDGTFSATGVSASSVRSMSARATAKGPIEALALTVAADAPAVADGPVKLTASGTLDGQNRKLALSKMEASWKQQVLRLLAPANFTFTDGVTMDRVRLGFRQAELNVSGRAGSTLDLTASLRDLPADIGTIVNPALAATGVIAADARLTGTGARPEGTIKLTATGVKQKKGPGQALPPANLIANATLQGTSARVDTRLTAGPSHVSVTGSVPLVQGGGLDLKTDADLDLAMLDPLLMAQGRRARGEITIDASVTGTTAAPLVQGSANLRRGSVSDYTLGAHISDLTANVQASGGTIRLTSFSGKAGPGTLGGSGTISLAGTMPVDLHFTANNARPLASDLITANIDANLTLEGELEGDLQAGGTLHVRRADIRIPDELPPSIAVLQVRNANAPPPPPPPPEAPPQSTIALNLTLDAPEQVFVRGRGLDAELGGTIHINGTTAQPIPDGGLHLRRGTFTVVGTTLNFTEGTVAFSGAGISDPSIHFVATSTTASITATLTVEGTAKKPKITLSSVPDMPQDEILSQLLFNTSTAKLSPFQLAQIAAALASMSGATSGFDPLESLRTTFGLDRLSVGTSSTGKPTLEAGRYLARGVYLGAKQSAAGGGTQATVQVDLAKGLKLETTAGSGNTSATGNTSGADAASVGLTYQFEY